MWAIRHAHEIFLSLGKFCFVFSKSVFSVV